MELGGLVVEPGTGVMADLWNLHRDPELWGPDADAFVPQRSDHLQPPLPGRKAYSSHWGCYPSTRCFKRIIRYRHFC